MSRALIFCCLLVLCTPALSHASVLKALVVEVQDGNTFVAVNVNRPVKVVLKGADAPDEGQPFSDVARQHLADLIMGKEVAVDYTGLGQNTSLVAKVFRDEMDVSQQMIRDGVAWYDRTYEVELSPLERRLYAESEQAARNEHRGIWQDTAPVSPWEFRQAQKLKQQAQASKSVMAQPAASSLSNHTNNEATASTDARPRNRSLTMEDIRLPGRMRPISWEKLAPEGEHFSILMPRDDNQVSFKLPPVPGRNVDAEMFAANHGQTIYMMLWATEVRNMSGITVGMIHDYSVENFKAGLKRSGELSGRNMACELTFDKEVVQKGFVGRQYTVSSCIAPGVMRLYYRISGNKLKAYMVAVMFNVEGDPNVEKFFDSFTIESDKPAKPAEKLQP